MTEIAAVTAAEVEASIARVIQHAESIWDEWAWQVENRAWEVKGYSSWDEMRTAEYTNIAGVTAPRAERPELVARFRNAGLTQRETAATLGVSRPTVQRHDTPTYSKASNDAFDEDVIDAEVIEDEPVPEFGQIEPSRPRRRPIADLLREAGADLDRAIERIERIAQDDRYGSNVDLIQPYLKNATERLNNLNNKE